MNVGQCGLQLKGLAIAIHRFGPFAQLPIGLAQIGVDRALRPLADQRSANQVGRHLILPALQRQRAQQMQGFRIVRLQLQHLAIDLLRFGQLAGLMESGTVFQGLFDRYHEEVSLAIQVPLAHQWFHIVR